MNGRRPFEKDHKIFNYDFDSEGEWEEGDGEGQLLPFCLFFLLLYYTIYTWCFFS